MGFINQLITFGAGTTLYGHGKQTSLGEPSDKSLLRSSSQTAGNGRSLRMSERSLFLGYAVVTKQRVVTLW